MGKKNKRKAGRELERRERRNFDRLINEHALEIITRELGKIAGMLSAAPAAIAGRREEKEKIYNVCFGFDIYSKSIIIKGKNIFYCVFDRKGNIAATVCLLISRDKKLAARGIAIRGQEDIDISLEKGRSIAFSRASFVAAEGKNTCHIRGKNRNIDIVKALFQSKYKAQYAPELTDYEKRLITDI